MSALLEVFYRPGAMFASLPERRNSWIVAVIVDALMLVLMSAAVTHYMGAENVARQQLAGFTRMPEEAREATIAKAGTPRQMAIGYASAMVGVPLSLAAIAGILLIFSMMTSRQPKFAAMYSMVAISFFPYWLITSLMTWLALMAAPDPASMDIKNLLATNVGAFMDKNALPKGLYSLLTSLDVLSFGEIGLLGYGFSKLTRGSLFGGIGAVVALWVLYVSSKMALSLLF